MTRTLLSALLLAPVSALAGGPILDISGACPGTVDVVASGFTPRGVVGVLRGSGPGGDPVPAGPCRGDRSGLAGLSLVTTVRADASGRVRVSPSVGGPLCGDLIQFIDASSCALSNTDEIGGGAPGGFYVAEGRNGAYGSEFGRVDLDAGTYTPINPVMSYSLTGLSFGPDGTLWGVQASGRMNPNIVRVDPATGGQVVVSLAADSGSFSAFGFGRDGQLYGWTENGDNFMWIDPLTGAVDITVMSIGTYNNCMAAGPDGLFYMLSGSSAYAIDPADPAAYVSLGYISGLAYSFGGGGCTFHEGNLYKSAGGRLYEINLDTMVATDTGIALPDGTDAIASSTP